MSRSEPTNEPRVWLVNLDAEHELEGGKRYTPSRYLRGIVAAQTRGVLGTLVRPYDVLLDPERPIDDRILAHTTGLRGLAWSPTPRARERLAAAGCTLDPAPEEAVLRAVNARPFAASVRAPLAEGSFAKGVATTLDAALALLAEPAPEGWLVRRAFGAAGRGRRRVAAGAPTEAELAWLRASLARGPLVVEPWVTVTREYTRSGWVDRGGAVTVAPPCFQETTTEGAWTRTDAAGRGEVAREDDARLEEAAAAAGEALARAGYFGPFGIDAFRHRVPGSTREVLNPMSEINARFTMDWTIGMGARAPHRAESPARV